MNGSGTIRVGKRDGSEEVFDPRKLAAAMSRPMRPTVGRLREALDMAVAIEIHLRRNGTRRISSAAVFEMTGKVLRRVGQGAAADAMEARRVRREDRRRRLCVRHESGALTRWDKGWLGELARRMWRLRPTTARILAGKVEERLLCGEARVVDRSDVLDALNDCVAQYGLADAVPVRPNAAPAPEV